MPNAFATGAVPRTPKEAMYYKLRAVSCQVVKVSLCWYSWLSGYWLAELNFLANKRNVAYFNIAWSSQSHVYLIYLFTISKILSKVDMFNTTLNLQN